MTDLRDRLQTVLGGGYRVDRELGGGGMSRVFVAEELRLGRRVVVKVLPPEMAAGVSVDRFEQEMQLAAKLQHPHIVPLLAAGSSEDVLYYTMPLIEGESLRARLAREGELPVPEVLRILRDVLDALAHAHGHRVVHRDIKPDNVLLSGKHALVTDFGVAKAVAASTAHPLTSLGVALGTPAYMAPEQATADPHTDHRADLYAVGAMAYEMLSGQPPFTGVSAQAVLAAHLADTPEPVTRHRAAVPEALSTLIQRCLEKKPADRPQRAEELLSQIEAMVTPTGGVTPTGTAPVISSGTAAAIRRSHPLRVAALFGLTSVVVLAVVYAAVQLIGLPDWVFLGAIALLVTGLPVMLVTGHHERRRALARSSGTLAATPPGGLAPYFTWRRVLTGAVWAFAALGVVTGAYMAMRALGIGPPGTLVSSGVLAKRDHLLLADFQNFTADTTAGASVTELLRIDLAQSRVVSLLEPRQVSEVLTRMGQARDTRVTPELAAGIAAREGIKAYITGEVRSVGAGLVVGARVVAATTGEALVTARETARSPDDLIHAVDRLSGTLRERIGESLRAVRADPPLAQVTTRSLDALRLYAQATEVANAGDYRRSVALLKEAVTRDSLFAMAWRRMGAYMTSQASLPRTMRDEGIAALGRAYALRDRLSERERYHVEAIYWAQVEQDPERAVTSYLALLERYPDDVSALNNIAVVYGRLGRTIERDDANRRAIVTGQAQATTYSNLIGSLRSRGLQETADTLAEEFAVRFPDNAQSLQFQAGLAGDRMRWDEVERIAEEASSKYATLEVWSLNTRAAVAALHGRLRDSRRLRHQAIQTDAARSNTSPDDRDLRLELRDLQDQVWFAEDRTQFAERVERLWQQNRRLTANVALPNRRYPAFIALFTRVGRTQRAEQLGEEFTGLMDQRTRDLPGIRRAGRRAEAAIALADGHAASAVESLRAAHEMNPECQLCDLVDLGEAYDQAGNADSAIAYYQRFLETPGNRLGTDAAWLPRTLKRLGELEAAKGDSAKALEYFGRFVDLWKDADPNLQPLVQDARQRMSRLTAERG